MIFVNILAITCVVIGLVFFLGASVGLLRFPDFYTRMHAAGKGDTLSTVMILLGCGIYGIAHHDIYYGSFLLAMKILFIAVFVFVGSPTATHAIMDAGYETEVKHWTKPEHKKK